jgi:hypothetical protein
MKKKNKKTAPNGRSSTFREQENGVPNKKKKNKRESNLFNIVSGYFLKIYF